MADQPSTTTNAPTVTPTVTPTTACVTAHRLEDNCVLVTPEDHELHTLEAEMRALEDAALATELTTPQETKEDRTDG